MLKNVGEKKNFAVIFFYTMDIKNTIFNPKFYQHFLPSLLITHIRIHCRVLYISSHALRVSRLAVRNVSQHVLMFYTCCVQKLVQVSTKNVSTKNVSEQCLNLLKRLRLRIRSLLVLWY